MYVRSPTKRKKSRPEDKEWRQSYKNMEDFVKTLLSTVDLSLLTKKNVRKRYKVHIGKTTLTDEEKFLLNKTVVSLLEDLAKQQENITDSAVTTQKNEKENVFPLDCAETEESVQTLSPKKTTKVSSSPRKGKGSKKSVANVRVDLTKSQQKTIQIGLKTTSDAKSEDAASIDNSIIMEDSDSDSNKNTRRSHQTPIKNIMSVKKLGNKKGLSPKTDFRTQEKSPKKVRNNSPRMMKLHEAVNSVLDSDESGDENIARMDFSSEKDQEVKKRKKNEISDDDDSSDLDKDSDFTTKDIFVKDNFQKPVKTYEGVKNYEKKKIKSLKDVKVCIEIMSDDSVKKFQTKVSDKQSSVKKLSLKKGRLSTDDDSEGKTHVFSISESDSERDKQMKKNLDVKVMGRKLNTIHEDVINSNTKLKRKRNVSDSDIKNSKLSKRRKLKKCDSDTDEDNVGDSNGEVIFYESEEDLPSVKHRKLESRVDTSEDDAPLDSELEVVDVPFKQKKTKSKHSKEKLLSNKSAKIDSEDEMSEYAELEPVSNSDSVEDSKNKNVTKSSRSSKVKKKKIMLESDSDSEEGPLSKQRISKFLKEQIDSGQESGFVENKRNRKSPTSKCTTPKKIAIEKKGRKNTKMQSKGLQKRKNKHEDSSSEVEDGSSEEEESPSEDENIPPSSVKKNISARDVSISEDEDVPLSSRRKTKKLTPKHVSSMQQDSPSKRKGKISSKDISEDDDLTSSSKKVNSRNTHKTKHVSSSDEDLLPPKKKGKTPLEDISDSGDEKRPSSSRRKSTKRISQDVSSSENFSNSEDEDELLCSRMKKKSKPTYKDISDSDDEDPSSSSRKVNSRKTPSKSYSSSDEDLPLKNKANTSNSKVRTTSMGSSESEGEDISPLRRKVNARKTSKTKSYSSSDEDLPLKKTGNNSNSKEKKTMDSSDSDGEDLSPSRRKVNSRKTSSKTKSYSSSDEDLPLKKTGNNSNSKVKKTMDSSDSDGEDLSSSRRKVNNRKTPKSYSSSDEDLPLKKKANTSNSKVKKTLDSSESEGEDISPLRRKVNARKTSKTKSYSSSDEDLPLKKTGNNSNSKVKKTMDSSESEDEDLSPSRRKVNSRKTPKSYSSSDEDLPLKKKGNSKVRKPSTDGSDSEEEVSEGDDELPTLTKKKSQTSRSHTKIASDIDVNEDSEAKIVKSGDGDESQSNKSDSNDDEGTIRKKKISPVRKRLVSSGSDSDADLATVKKKSVEKKHQNTSKSKVSSDSDSDADLATVKKKNIQNNKTNTSSSKSKSVEKPYLKNLRKICHALGMILRNTIELKGCETEDQKIRRLKEILKKAGMQGQPSMSKVKKLKLLKEAAQLDTSNILSSDTGRATRSRVPTRKSPKKSVCVSPSITKTFSRLKGIVDSEGSESD